MNTNRLIHESSPYLLQHAHNPVDWFPWGNEAIQKSREEDKPILVSIGYSACHWCHVMERESFEDPGIADFMNSNFINIKIDREERPDLDHIYMDAVQAIAGNGGWPLNVFLTPDCKPFFGGTYFPPRDFHNRPSWKSVLLHISDAFKEKRKEITDQAEYLTKHIAGTVFGDSTDQNKKAFNVSDPDTVFDNLIKTADRKDGGFGSAPKFPQTFSVRFLLQYHYYHRNHPEERKNIALQQACLSLDKMIRGGIYDQLGGGFSRYSTDAEWLAPHFEKMLYDNALLVIAMSEAYQSTGKFLYRKAIEETMVFLNTELLSTQGGYFSALDADSDGEEGKYYIWEKKEIDAILGSDSAEFCAYYDVTDGGNWESSNILRIKNDGIPIAGEKEQIWKQKLMEKRNQRNKPSLDDKILLGWNALMISAACKAYAALGNEEYLKTAIQTLSFLENNMKGTGVHHFYHTYKNQLATIPAFLDDYAYLIEAYILMQESTGEGKYLDKAKELLEWVLEHFSEEDNGFFYYTHIAQDDVIVRKRDVYDGATPSGNSVMAANMNYLGIVFDVEEWKNRAAGNVSRMKETVLKYPGSFGVWATLLNGLTYKIPEIVLAGGPSIEKHREFLSKAVPNRVFQLNSVTPSVFPLLRNKPVQGPPLFFLCRDYSCQPPVKEVSELQSLLKNS